MGACVKYFEIQGMKKSKKVDREKRDYLLGYLFTDLLLYFLQRALTANTDTVFISPAIIG